MFLVRVVESLITDVLITPENLPEPQKVFDGITGQIKEVARSLSYLNIDDETVNEASSLISWKTLWNAMRRKPRLKIWH